MRHLVLMCLILSLASFAFAQEAKVEIFLPRDSLNTLVQALDGTQISYEAKGQEDLQGARLTIGHARILGMGEGRILVGLEGSIWIDYRPRPEESLGISLGKSLEVKTSVDFGSELSLTPQVDEARRKLVLRASVSKLDLRRAEGLYQLLIQVPGMEAIIRSEINKALSSMRQEILDLSPYLMPQEFALQEERWKADHTLLLEPKEVKIEVGPEALVVRAFGKVASRPIEQPGN